MITRPHGRPNGALLARIQRRLTPRWQTVAQIAGDDMVGDVARALSTLERDGLAEREGQRWRAPQPPEQAPTPEVVEPVVELAPVVPPPPPAPPVDLPAAVQEAARRRDWWTRTELATSVEIRTGAGRGAIEVEIARQLDDGRLQTEARGIRIRVPPELPAEPEATPAAAPQFEPAIRGWRTAAAPRVLAALAERPGQTLHELGAAVGVSSSRAGQLVRELGCLSVAEAPGRTARRRWYPPGWSPDTDTDTDTDSTPPSPEPGSQTLAPQAPASGGVQVEAEPAPVVEAPTWPDLPHHQALIEYRGRRIEEIEAERQELEETVQQLEAELRAIRSQRVAVDDGPRQELAQIRALVGTEHPTPIAVALLVGEARALRGRP